MINIIDYKNGVSNKTPIITNLKVAGEPTQSSIKITYHVEDAENQIVRHYLTISNLYDKKEITPEVGYDKSNFEYNITGLEAGKTYSIMITCFDGVNECKSNIIQQETKSFLIWSIQVDESNSNPKSSVKYIEQSTTQSFASGSSWGSWKDKWPFNKIRSCGFKNGKIFKYLKNNDNSTYEDGTKVSNEEDIMVEFPKIYWNFIRITNGYEIRISDIKVNDSYICPAHTIGNREVDNIYIGTYKGFIDEDGKLRSLSGKIPTTKVPIGNCRESARKNGIGYQQMSYYPLLMLQVLYLIMYKSLDSQEALGKGYTVGNSQPISTGGTDKMDMIYGENIGNKQMKFLGIEDLWGNTYEWIDGLFYNSNHHILLSNQSIFNNNGDQYEDCGLISNLDLSGCPSSVSGNSKTGFLMTNSNGSTTTYYCDNSNMMAGYLCRFGGNYNSRLGAGIFGFDIYYSETEAYDDMGSRLIYLG